MLRWLNLRGIRHSTDHRFPKDAPLGSLSYSVVDTELTSLNSRSNRLLSIGAVGMEADQVGRDLLDLPIPQEGILIHKLCPDEIANGIAPAEALAQLEMFLRGTVVVGHFVDIDLKVLSKEGGQVGGVLQHSAIDAARAQKWVWDHGSPPEKHGRDTDRLDLATLAKEYRIQFQEAHHALQDAFVTAQLWQRIVSRLQAMNVKTLGAVLRIAGVSA